MAQAEGSVQVYVVYATSDSQRVYEVRVQRGATVRMAIAASGIEQDFRHIDFGGHPVGIFGERVDDGTAVKDGDRIEIYRPLLANPKESRRRRAAKRARD